jgi:hypothetical protein
MATRWYGARMFVGSAARRSQVSRGGACALAAIVAAVVAAGAAGCGSSAADRKAGNPKPAGREVAATSVFCVPAFRQTGSTNEKQCMFVFADGRRFRCPTGSTSPDPTPSVLVRKKECTEAPSLVLSATVLTTLSRRGSAETCLAARGLRVSAGPPAYPNASGARAADGVLLLGQAAAIAVYADVNQARLLAPAVTANAAHVGERVERHGSVLVLWLARPSTASLRGAVLGCVSI